MSFYCKSAAVVAATIAAIAAPAFAAEPPAETPDQDNPGAVHKPESPPPSNDGTDHKPDSTDGTDDKPATPGPKAGLPAKAKAYGRYCQDQSKKQEEGEKGTPFSRCVTAMAKLANGKTSSPRKACKELSKKHDKGEQGTPFSRCVSHGAQLLRDQKAHDGEGEH
jgi:hypothetical protein